MDLKRSEFYRINMEKRLEQIFTKNQVKKLKNGVKRLNWTDEDIAKSITIYSASPKTLLRKKQFPLPITRTLNSWAQKCDISRGIIDPVIKIMKAATQLSEEQKVCVLSFDEMKVKECYCYDKSSDTLYKPVKYAQLVMIRGLYNCN